MRSPEIVMLWSILLVVLLAAGWQKKWWSFGIYASACVIFIVEMNRSNGDWQELADIATLIVFIIPLYLLGTIIWMFSHYWERKRK